MQQSWSLSNLKPFYSAASGWQNRTYQKRVIFIPCHQCLSSLNRESFWIQTNIRSAQKICDFPAFFFLDTDKTQQTRNRHNVPLNRNRTHFRVSERCAVNWSVHSHLTDWANRADAVLWTVLAKEMLTIIYQTEIISISVFLIILFSIAKTWNHP